MAMDPRAAMRAAIAVPGVPRDADGPVFREPWEAQAFAMTLALHERGVFTWPEWAAALAAEIKRAQSEGDPDTGETYYSHWLNTLEKLHSCLRDLEPRIEMSEDLRLRAKLPIDRMLALS